MIGEIKKLAHLLRDFPLFILVGIGAGFVGYAFRLFVSWAGIFRHQYPNLIFLLPITAIFITVLYRFVLKDRKNGTKTVISAVRNNSSLKTVQLPLVFLASILTHLTGGSAGREGAVLEMGGVLGNQAVSLLRSPVKKGRRHHKIRFLSEQETYDTQRRVAILCGMAGAFSALFVNFCLQKTKFLLFNSIFKTLSAGELLLSRISPFVCSRLARFPRLPKPIWI